MHESEASMGARIKHVLKARLYTTAPRMRVIHLVSAVVAVVLAIACMVVLGSMLDTYRTAGETNDAYDRCERAVETMQEASDYLTAQVRLFTTSADKSYLDAYLAELQYRQRREKAVLSLKEQASSAKAIASLEEAEQHSNELAEDELYAIKLVLEATDEQHSSEILKKTLLSAEDAALSAQEKRDKANRMVYGEGYLNKKLLITTNVHACSNELMDNLRREMDANNEQLDFLLGVMRASIVALLLVVLFIIGSMFYLVLWPISMYAKQIRKDDPLIPSGARELRLLTNTYNEMYEEKHRHALMLQQEAETDGLTSLFNRGAFETFMGSCMKDIALILVDVDNFKTFNDDFGHDMGDAILIEVAATLLDAFRSSDYVCRIGGDEFAVIMTAVNVDMQDTVATKLMKVSEFLRSTDNGLPSVTVSMGIAFDSDVAEGEDLFKVADEALYKTKEDGRDGYTFACDVK